MTGPVPPTRVPGASRAVAVAVGNGHHCLIRDDGTLHCGGATPTASSASARSTAPSHRRGSRASRASSRSASASSTVGARLLSGEVYCWGANSAAQLGDGTRESRDLPTPLLDITDAVSVAAGGSFSSLRRPPRWHRHLCRSTTGELQRRRMQR